MSGNFAIKGGGGVGPLMANAILNFHFDFLNPSLIKRFKQNSGTMHHEACFHVKEVVYKREKRGRVVPEK